MQPRASISSSAPASPGAVSAAIAPFVDQHVGLARAAGRDHEAATDSERGAHRAARGHRLAAQELLQRVRVALARVLGRQVVADRLQRGTQRDALLLARGIAGARHEHDGVAMAQILVQLLGDLLEPGGGDVVRVPGGGELHDAEARAAAHLQGVEPTRLRVDERVGADGDAEAPRVTFHVAAPAGC